MAIERTLSIVKPDGVQKNVIGDVYRRFEQAGLRIVAARMLRLSQTQAEGFYAGPSRAAVLPRSRDLHGLGSGHGPGPRGEGAVAKNREIMGATDPKKADRGTIRADLATSIEQNVVHGSDSAENAAREIAYFFAETELCPR
jgi:nucleoside-diphosphate kinase